MHEGFGLPVIEAMACGVPVVCSDRPALPEIASDAAIFVKPDRPDELAAALRTVIADPAVRRKYSDAGLARAGMFTWERAAEQTMQIYKYTFGNGRR
jgi:alpha-1,3-rhamnosyl/mannosyltransferase